jgi:predicted transcriptional regulator
MDIYNQMELQDHKIIHIHGLVFPSKDKEVLPQENKDNSNELIAKFEKIFQEVNNM